MYITKSATRTTRPLGACGQCATHTKNRSGTMIGLYECHAHGRKISIRLQPVSRSRLRRRLTTDDDARRRRPTRRRFAAASGGFKSGFSWSKASACTAVEAPPAGSDALKLCIEKNRKLAARSREMLPMLQEGAVRVQVIGGNHTTAFVRAVRAGCKSPIKELCDENGRLDVAKFSEQPGFVEAVKSGLKYKVVAYVVEQHVPGFVDFVRNARRPRCPVVVVVIVAAVIVAAVVVSTRFSHALQRWLADAKSAERGG